MLESPARMAEAIVGQSRDGLVFILDEELFGAGDWPFFGRYALVTHQGHGFASTNSLEAAQHVIGV